MNLIACISIQRPVECLPTVGNGGVGVSLAAWKQIDDHWLTEMSNLLAYRLRRNITFQNRSNMLNKVGRQRPVDLHGRSFATRLGSSRSASAMASDGSS